MEEEPAESDLCDRPRSDRPCSANIDQADALIKENRCITINELAKSLGVSARSALKIMDTLGYSKVCARCIPRQLTEAHKQSHLEACSELVEYCHSEKIFLQQMVIRDETWVYHFKPESKRASMEWHHPTSPHSKKFKSQQSAGKVIVTVFWDSVGVILYHLQVYLAKMNINLAEMKFNLAQMKIYLAEIKFKLTLMKLISCFLLAIF